ncbi:uncharacterized protein LOC142775592 isoform X2 [Rhipicephalus microplus]|uniref:uncharacterized protein LOC142775592 isoform X2 n=1 Tax=Rhipicephalus microplus TaxID=6941 RepID=UPI003F6C794F
MLCNEKACCRLSSTLNSSRFRSDEGLSELSGRLSIQQNGSDPGSHTGSKLSLFSRATQRFSISSSRIPDLRSPLTATAQEQHLQQLRQPQARQLVFHVQHRQAEKRIHAEEFQELELATKNSGNLGTKGLNATGL